MMASMAFVAAFSAFAADQVILQFQPSGDRAAVLWRSQLALPVSGMYPEYSLLRSTNMCDWTIVGDPVSGGVGVSDESLGMEVSLNGESAFYRLQTKIKLASAESRLGDAIYGYGTEFNRQLQALGQLPLADFVTAYGPTNTYLTQISFDPTTAEFWSDFNLDPAVHNATNAEPRYVDFRLNTNELAIFRTNGLWSANVWAPTVLVTLSIEFIPMTCRFSFPPTPRCTPGINRTSPCSRSWKKPRSLRR